MNEKKYLNLVHGHVLLYQIILRCPQHGSITPESTRCQSDGEWTSDPADYYCPGKNGHY